MVDQRILARFPRMVTVMVTLSFLSAIFFIAGPLYMIELYSNILPARSNETLLVASFFVIIAFIGFWAVERTRLRVASRWAAKLDDAIGKELEASVANRSSRRQNFNTWKSLRGFMNSAGFLALFDLPASLILFAVLAYIHPLLAGFAVVILIVSFSLAATAFATSHKWNKEFEQIQWQQENLSRHLNIDSVTLLPKQSQARLWNRWRSNERTQFFHQQMRNETIGGGNTIIKSSRIAAQSMLLGLGAWLIMQDAMSMSTLLAASVLGARALAPYDALAQSFGSLQTALASRKILKTALREYSSSTSEPMTFSANLDLQSVRMALPGTRSYFFRDLNIHCSKGSVTLLSGPSGSGKSALLAVIAGVLEVQQGKISRPEKVSYQPLQTRFIDGTIFDNIAHLNENPQMERLTELLDTFGLNNDLEAMGMNLTSKITVGGSTPEGRVLPGNFLRKLALARSLIEDPDLIVWDQPFSGMDRTSRDLLSQIISSLKSQGKTIVLTTDPYPSGLNVDTIIVLKEGAVHKSGPAEAFFNKKGLPTPHENKQTLKMVSVNNVTANNQETSSLGQKQQIARTA